MARAHVITGFAASIGTLGIVTAIGFAQPDGLQPPAGSVDNTQPSLTSIEALLLSFGNGTSGPSNATQFTNIALNGDVQIDVGTIRLERVIMQKGVVDMQDASGTMLRLEAGQVVVSGTLRPVADFSNELNIDLVGPVVFTSVNATNNADFIVVYKELP